MATSELDSSVRSKQKYRGWLTIRRSKPNKKKYNVQDAVPHNSPIPDENTAGKTAENDDEDVPTLIQRLQIIESVEDHQDPKALISTQRLLIDVLRKENAAFRILKTQVEKLRKENSELRAETRLLRTTTGADYYQANHQQQKEKEKGRNGRSNNVKGGIQNGVKGATQNGGKGGIQNSGDVKRQPNGEDRVQESNGPMVNGHSDLTNSNGGLTNGHWQHSEGVNGLTNGVDGIDGSGDAPKNGRHPNQKLVRENGASTSGTSLITVTCLYRTMGKLQDCDETVQARLKARMAAKGVDLVMNPWARGQDAHQITVVCCLAASARLSQDVTRALEEIGDTSEVVLVMFHNVASSSNRQDPQTESLPMPLQNVCLVIDIFFNKAEGLYHCEQNNRSMGRLFRLFDILC